MLLKETKKIGQQLLHIVVSLVLLPLIYSSSVSAMPQVTKIYKSSTFQIESIPSVVELKKEVIYKIRVDENISEKNLKIFLEASMQKNEAADSMAGHQGMSEEEMAKAMPTDTNKEMSHPVSAQAAPTKDPLIYEAKLVFPMEGAWQISVISKSKSSPFNFVVDEEVKKVDKKGWIDYANFIAIILVASFVLFRGRRQLKTSKKTKDMIEAK